ncbi:NACHT domain-containing protein, partial [Nocardia gipuzkoensis]
TRLRDEMGIEPEQTVPQLQIDILNGTSGPATPPARRRRGESRKLAQLPPAVPHFVGRQSAIDASFDLLTAGGGARTICVHGMPGVGKSAVAGTIALTVADSYPDGQLYIDLRNAERSALAALSDVLRALGVEAAELPSTVAGSVALFRSITRGRRILVVLDDFPRTADLAAFLPLGSTTIITARRPVVGLFESTKYHLGPLPSRDGLELLAT